MNDFIANNGAIVKKDFDSGTGWFSAIVRTVDNDVRLAGVHVDALREFFRAEEDERLGRWRWPENPDYVVCAWTADPARRDVRGVTVLSEAIPRGYTVWEDNVETLYGTSTDEEARKSARSAARAYFDAHPEPKPWHVAKPGDVWVLSTVDYPEEAAYTYGETSTGVYYFERHDREANCYELRDTRILSGRRIWPVESP